jgi:endoglucanase
MQCKKTGGVYHKVSCRSFNALNEHPHDEKNELILSPISLTATADFAATTALASRFYPNQKTRLLKAAERAWEWCAANPDAENFVNPPEITTGQYGDSTAKDEVFWAACELFAATGAEKYHDAIKKTDFSEIVGNAVHSSVGLGWSNMGTYGIASYLHAAKRLPSEPAIVQKCQTRLREICEHILKKYATEPFGTSLGGTYRWGSNMDVANNAKALLLYSRLVEQTPAYENAAKEHIHYLLGRNPLSQSYVTGFGAFAPKDPHHRPSVAVGTTFPGMVVGGPNPTTPRDVVLQSHCEGRPPSMFYIDHKDSFASNEIAIYWNSSVYFVVSVLDF